MCLQGARRYGGFLVVFGRGRGISARRYGGFLLLLHRSRENDTRRYGGFLVVSGRSPEISTRRYGGCLQFLHRPREKHPRRCGGFLVVLDAAGKFLHEGMVKFWCFCIDHKKKVHSGLVDFWLSQTCSNMHLQLHFLMRFLNCPGHPYCFLLLGHAYTGSAARGCSQFSDLGAFRATRATAQNVSYSVVLGALLVCN